MFSFSMPELVLILVIALIVFGPGKLPEVGKAIGKGIQEFRRASTDIVSPKEEPIKVEAKTEAVNKQPEEKK
ncbi:Sec-independent protein translocase subunit TatA/TatB [Sporomusa acidovorans]|uniref:Sec-independent protein translocase protein TatA n=1 Tax=Sporomusa acidovorans (strain ATCC 49682 / DSM 3132 / Mol) TaxID=1123286 RepID=A0ABZ3J1C0_SPOA4|nr:twin-arginine translocase TatA/TatE family subunit [Sporomusa acidovorans]OZC14462.1 Sec-independent protein translocase protein TatAd [Sporomusa acidovorans DSM 3132]SDF49827.1 sec-independent protein translocase protein TatA [Sporomusa acidovorans]